ncbi:hypothetical protein P22_1328 [Propionispora sp. 2/2-37]|uniref:guanine deaminase n=1 Tax=Propionispora sp. 2/2-37 TaxID=1677858 RepID=UPI0006BB771F|nr:guanine deaminase [Propionispora sp. 2/2-37]CUH95258.1 hypothetical protein P22_1328 [Propionispora sp. 2/2-37]
MQKGEVVILRGNIVFTPEEKSFSVYENSYLVACHGRVEGIFTKLPEQYQNISVHDCGNGLIIPGFVDLHTHASQYGQRGLGLDYTLLDWLREYTFKEENKFSDPVYATHTYQAFTEEVIAQGTTRVVAFATIHQQSTRILCEILARRGVGAYVGKVNMDDNCPSFMKENTQKSLQETEAFIYEWMDHPLVKPIITPRFAPTCSRTLLEGLGKFAAQYKLPVQSHLSENVSEIKWVQELFPECKEYHQVYQQYKLFGQTPTVMAHCVHMSEEAIQSMRENQVIAVHCPDSNMNLTSGIMPLRKLLNNGVKVGLGTDIGAGHSLSMPQTIVKTIQLSKIRSLFEKKEEPLTLSEVFYLATKGGGNFFGRVGSFERGYWLDALVISQEAAVTPLSPLEKLQQFIYTGTPACITARYINGKKINF